MIKNVETATYLTIWNYYASGGYPAILTAGQSGDSSQQFYIETDSNGNVTIYPKYGEASNAILAAQTTSSGAYIGQGNATSDNRDKWVIFVPQKTVKVNVLYDQGYLDRYGTGETETEKTNSVVTRINGIMQAIRLKYYTDCDTYVNYSTPTLFTSFADACNETDYDEICSCGSCSNEAQNSATAVHHKNYNQIFNHLRSSDLSESITIAFIGHKTCTKDLGFCVENIGTMGLALYSNGKSCIFSAAAGDLEEPVAVHEFGHLLGAIDHYGYNGITTDVLNDWYSGTVLEGKFDDDCIYGLNKEDDDVVENRTLCEGCDKYITSFGNTFNHGFE